jgi:hypothetical protein
VDRPPAADGSRCSAPTLEPELASLRSYALGTYRSGRAAGSIWVLRLTPDAGTITAPARCRCTPTWSARASPSSHSVHWLRWAYYPGWWEGTLSNQLMINLRKWNELPKRYQAILSGAAAYANSEELAKYDARNPTALRRLIAGRTELRAFTPSILEACLKASNEVNAETAAKNADFKRVLEAMQAFRNEGYFWWQVAEYSYDTFMIRSRPHA